jgi:hypothetical protein
MRSPADGAAWNAGDCPPERRVSRQIERLCGVRESNNDDGSHRCYLQLGHDGPHHCACEYEWTKPSTV